MHLDSFVSREGSVTIPIAILYDLLSLAHGRILILFRCVPSWYAGGLPQRDVPIRVIPPRSVDLVFVAVTSVAYRASRVDPAKHSAHRGH